MKRKILYCEDQENYRQHFENNHKDNFEIELISNLRELLSKLKGMDKLPDLLLLDLYHPRGSRNQEKNAETANLKLKELREKTKEVKEYVDKAWAPDALEVLREIRRYYTSQQLPVLIYTQRGLLLLDDLQVREVEKLEAGWLIKDSERITPTTEELRIERFIARCKKYNDKSNNSLITPFISMSFDKRDYDINNYFMSILKRLRIDFITGEKYCNVSIEEKVRNNIAKSKLFIGFFVARDMLENGKYITPEWLLKELNIALGYGIGIIALVERGVDDIAGLDQKKELIYFERNNANSIQEATLKFLDALGFYGLV